MAKRGAASYLTDQNWDQEDEQEEAGEFVQAADDILKKREIRKAKRRGVTTGESSSSGTGGIFKGFAGFTTTKPANSASTFGNFGGVSNGQKEGIKMGGIFGAAASSASSSTTATTASTDAAPKSATGQEESPKTVVNGTGSKSKSKYLAQLKALNESVTRWIKEHVDKNPYVILSPIFSDYAKHLADIEKKYPVDRSAKGSTESEKKEETDKKESSDTEKNEPAKKEDSPAAPAPTFSFQSGLTAATTAPATSPKTTSIFSGSGAGAGGFTFGGAKPADSSATSTTTSGFTFGSATSGSSTSSGIFGGSSGGGGFGGAGGFSFASKPAESSAKTEEAAAPEEYVPPKNEVTEVKEEGAFYSKRCKLYVKKGEAWKEKGIGNLHLKPCNGKTQLIIRADTNLGNILLNIMLSSSIPMGRQGKNNVSLMCVPNPPLDEKNPDDKTPVSMLVRVKTGEDADELLAKMKDAPPS